MIVVSIQDTASFQLLRSAFDNSNLRGTVMLSLPFSSNNSLLLDFYILCLNRQCKSRIQQSAVKSQWFGKFLISPWCAAAERWKLYRCHTNLVPASRLPPDSLSWEIHPGKEFVITDQDLTFQQLVFLKFWKQLFIFSFMLRLKHLRKK